MSILNPTQVWKQITRFSCNTGRKNQNPAIVIEQTNNYAQIFYISIKKDILLSYPQEKSANLYRNLVLTTLFFRWILKKKKSSFWCIKLKSNAKLFSFSMLVASFQKQNEISRAFWKSMKWTKYRKIHEVEPEVIIWCLHYLIAFNCRMFSAISRASWVVILQFSANRK